LPVNLPTYDEVIGRDGISAAQYNAHLLGMMKADTYQLYTIHAEVEGGSQLALFDAMLREAKQRGIRFVPLRDIAGALDVALLPQCTLGRGTVAGREGWVAVKGA
jgi:undecaprenyl phosphate-alpha-L-ara4FN deformylase